jgi:Phasin protein
MADTKHQQTPDQRERGGAEAVQALRTGSDAVRRTAEAGAEATRRAGEAAGEITRRGTQAAAESGRQLAEETAEQVEETGRQLTRVVQDIAEDVQRLMVLPHAAEGGLRDVQQALGGLVDGVVRTNLRAAQELVRLADPGAVIELQHRFAREYLDTLLEGQATLLRAVRRTAEETLLPLEAQIEQRRADAGRRERIAANDDRAVRRPDAAAAAE